MIRCCKNCSYGMRGAMPDDDKEIKVIWCCFNAPIPVIDPTGRIHYIRPPMKDAGWCGQFWLSLRKLFGRSDG